MDKPLISKVVAYITNRNRLLVFRHTQYPEAGIQVPAGSMEAGEAPLAAARREAQEESGLENLKLVSFLGERDFDGARRGEVRLYHRYFYHFEAPGDQPVTWLHNENDPSDHSARFYEFEFEWADLPGDVPELAGAQDALLPELMRSLGHMGYIRRCFELARRAARKGNPPYGALLVHQGRVILEAQNTGNTTHDLTRHADLNLVSRALRKFHPDILAESTFYSSTEPCVMCSGAIQMTPISSIVYGVATRTLVGGPTLDSRAILGSQVRVEGPILEEEGLELFKD